MVEAGPGSVRSEGLVRVIGVGALGLGVVNMVVGAGIFVLPGRIAEELGSAAIFAYLICSVAVALVFLCFAEVGSRVTRSGGSYAYIEEAFGPFAGFVASILLWTLGAQAKIASQSSRSSAPRAASPSSRIPYGPDRRIRIRSSRAS